MVLTKRYDTNAVSQIVSIVDKTHSDTFLSMSNEHSNHSASEVCFVIKLNYIISSLPYVCWCHYVVFRYWRPLLYLHRRMWNHNRFISLCAFMCFIQVSSFRSFIILIIPPRRQEKGHLFERDIFRRLLILVVVRRNLIQQLVYWFLFLIKLLTVCIYYRTLLRFDLMYNTCYAYCSGFWCG